MCSATSRASPMYARWPPRAKSPTRRIWVKISRRGWWIDMITVVPCDAICDTRFTTLIEAVLSRPEVGSSRNSTGGCVSSSTAIETRRFSPPEIPRCMSLPMVTSEIDERPSCITTSLARSFLSANETLVSMRSCAWSSSCSDTVSEAGRMSSCTTYPDTARRCLALSGRPLRRTVPVVRPWFLRPARISSSEVLPAPEGPISAQTSPGGEVSSSRLNGPAQPETDCITCFSPNHRPPLAGTQRQMSSHVSTAPGPTDWDAPSASLSASAFALGAGVYAMEVGRSLSPSSHSTVKRGIGTGTEVGPVPQLLLKGPETCTVSSSTVTCTLVGIGTLGTAWKSCLANLFDISPVHTSTM
mmetsp:Transcript_68686/g.191556  ORF Transcript_68686/g.191556 Transcript_68686/m.191556 type:complete len:357 (+) Transcript_68686:1758-2828(+)